MILKLFMTAFVYFHAPNGDIVSIAPGDGQIIIRPVPPGYNGRTLIETGVGNVIVTETPCQVAHALTRKCPH